MEISGYDIDLEKAVKIIKENDYKQVVLQVPEGLKSYFSKFVEFLEDKTNASIIISADPCFGACDLVNYEFKNLDVDFAIQIGHTEIADIENYWIPIIFLNASSTLKISNVVEKSLPELTGKHIGLVTTAQHIHKIDEITEILENHDFNVVISEGDKRIFSKGQILGCNFTAATHIADKVDSFLFVGSGNFHPLGVSLTTKKPVVAADPYTNKVKTKELDELKDTILRQRYGAIAHSSNAKNFGILIGMKRGQQRIQLAHEIKKMLVSYGKQAILIAMDNFSFTSLQGFGNIDCIVSTACPRIAIDDYLQYKIPIITPSELEILLKKKKWEDYTFDQILA